MSSVCCLEFNVAFTKFSKTPLALSRNDKFTVCRTLPSRFTMKSISLKVNLLECSYICRIVNKNHNNEVLGLFIWSRHNSFLKKSTWIFAFYTKYYQSTILLILCIFQTRDRKFKPDIITK